MDLVAGGLLILLTVLFVVGSFLDLTRFRVDFYHQYTQQPDGSFAAPAHQEWRAWEFTSSGVPDTPDSTQQLLGIAIVLVAVVAVIGAVLALTGLAARLRSARAITVAAASMAIGLAVTLVVDVANSFLIGGDTSTIRLGAGFWVFVAAAVVALPTLVVVLVAGKKAPASTPLDGYGRPLTRRASGLEIVVGALLIPLAGLMAAATFCHLLGGTTMWSSLNDHIQFFGAPLVLGAVAALIAAALSFAGRGRTMGSLSAAALFAAGLLLSLDEVDGELFGPVGFGDLGVGAWLLFAATALALIVTVLAVAAAATKPRYRTPYAPVPQQYPGWAPAPSLATPPPTWVQPPQVPQAGPQNPAPPQPVWPQPEQGWQQPPQGR
ncbi:hypothetical protein GCM10027167_89530 [Nocardia heshunensis]